MVVDDANNASSHSVLSLELSNGYTFCKQNEGPHSVMLFGLSKTVMYKVQG